MEKEIVLKLKGKMKADLILGEDKLVNVEIVDLKPYHVIFLWKRKYIIRNINSILKYDVNILDANECKYEHLCEYEGRFNIYTKKQTPFDGFDNNGLRLKAELLRVRNRLKNIVINNEDKLNEKEKETFINTISDLDLLIMKKYKEVRL